MPNPNPYSRRVRVHMCYFQYLEWHMTAKFTSNPPPPNHPASRRGGIQICYFPSFFLIPLGIKIKASNTSNPPTSHSASRRDKVQMCYFQYLEWHMTVNFTSNPPPPNQPASRGCGIQICYFPSFFLIPLGIKIKVSNTSNPTPPPTLLADVMEFRCVTFNI